jgi:hypothetical protein
MASKRRLDLPARKHPADKKTKKSRVVVGEPWPEDIEVETASYPSVEEQRTHLGISLTKLFGVLLVLLTVYGMSTANQELLSTVLRLVQHGIIFALGWAWGRSP